MARGKQNSEIEILVDGDLYVWRLHRQPGWSSDSGERHGMAIIARHKEGQREVTVEFPPDPTLKFGAPLLKAAQVKPTLIAAALTSAIAAGWEPLSRGKMVFVIVDAQGR